MHVYIYIYTYIYIHTMHRYLYIYIMCKSWRTIIIWIGLLKVNVTCLMVRFDQDASNIGSMCSYYLFFRFNLHHFSGEVLTTGYELGCVQCSWFLPYAPTFLFARCGTYFFSMQLRRSEPKLKIWNTANHPVCLWNVLVIMSSIDPIFLQTHSFIVISLRLNSFWYLFHLGIAERDTYSQY